MSLKTKRISQPSAPLGNLAVSALGFRKKSKIKKSKDLSLAAFATCCLPNPPPLIPRMYDTARVTRFHGKRKLDPFSWLENPKDPKVKDVLKRENKYVENFFQLPSAWEMKRQSECIPKISQSALPSLPKTDPAFSSTSFLRDSTVETEEGNLFSSYTSSLRKNIFSEMVKRVKENDLCLPVHEGPFWYYSREIKNAEYPIFCRRPYDPVKGVNVNFVEEVNTFRETCDLDAEEFPVYEDEVVYFDPNLFMLELGLESLEVGDCEISHDHEQLAVMVDVTEGKEIYTLFVLRIQNVSLTQWLAAKAPRVVKKAVSASSNCLPKSKQHSVYEVLFSPDMEKDGGGNEKEEKNKILKEKGKNKSGDKGHSNRLGLDMDSLHPTSSFCITPPTCGFYCNDYLSNTRSASPEDVKKEVRKKAVKGAEKGSSSWVESPKFAAYQCHMAKWSNPTHEAEKHQRTSTEGEGMKSVPTSTHVDISVSILEPNRLDKMKRKKPAKKGPSKGEAAAGTEGKSRGKGLEMVTTKEKEKASLPASVATSMPYRDTTALLPPRHRILHRIEKYKMGSEVLWGGRTSVLYLGLDDAMRPYQVIYHDLAKEVRLGTTQGTSTTPQRKPRSTAVVSPISAGPEGTVEARKGHKSNKGDLPPGSGAASPTVVCYEEKDDAFWVGCLCLSSDRHYFMFQTASSDSSEWYISPMRMPPPPLTHYHVSPTTTFNEEKTRTEDGIGKEASPLPDPCLLLSSGKSEVREIAQERNDIKDERIETSHDELPSLAPEKPGPTSKIPFSSAACTLSPELVGVPLVIQDKKKMVPGKDFKADFPLAPVYCVLPRIGASNTEEGAETKKKKKKNQKKRRREGNEMASSAIEESEMHSPNSEAHPHQTLEKSPAAPSSDSAQRQSSIVYLVPTTTITATPSPTSFSSLKSIEYDVEHHEHLFGLHQGGWLIRSNRDGCLNFTVWCVPESPSSTSPSFSKENESSLFFSSGSSRVTSFASALPPAFPDTPWIPLLEYDPLITVESIEVTKYFVFFSVRQHGVANTLFCPLPVIWNWWRKRSAPPRGSSMEIEDHKGHIHDEYLSSAGEAGLSLQPNSTALSGSSSSSCKTSQHLLSCADFLDLAAVLRCFWRVADKVDGGEEREAKNTLKNATGETIKESTAKDVKGNAKYAKGRKRPVLFDIFPQIQNQRTEQFHHSDPSLLSMSTASSKTPFADVVKDGVAAILKKAKNKETERDSNAHPVLEDGRTISSSSTNGEMKLDSLKFSPLPLTVESVHMEGASFDCTRFRLVIGHLLNPMDIYEMEYISPHQSSIYHAMTTATSTSGNKALSSSFSELGQLRVRQLHEETVKGGYVQEEYDGITVWVPSDYYSENIYPTLSGAHEALNVEGNEAGCVERPTSTITATTTTMPHTTHNYSNSSSSITTTTRVVSSSNTMFSPVPTKSKSPRREIPVYLIWKKSSLQEGKNPLVLHVYGSYGSCCDLDFSVERLSLLDRGFIWGTAAVRGGGEFGTLWRDEGRKLQRGTTVNDFLSVSSFIQDHEICAPGKLISWGGSAGGLVVCRAMHAAPHLFHAVIGECPFVDCLSSLLRPDLPLTVTEWDEFGDPTSDPEAYDLLASLSPVDTIPPPFLSCPRCADFNAPLSSAPKPGKKKQSVKGLSVVRTTKTICNGDSKESSDVPCCHCTPFSSSPCTLIPMPHVFLDTSINDTRVSYWESLKLAARLRERIAALTISEQKRASKKITGAKVQTCSSTGKPVTVESSETETSLDSPQKVVDSFPNAMLGSKKMVSSTSLALSTAATATEGGRAQSSSVSHSLVLHHCAFDTGHAGAAGRYQWLHEVALKYAFALLIVTPFFSSPSFSKKETIG